MVTSQSCYSDCLSVPLYLVSKNKIKKKHDKTLLLTIDALFMLLSTLKFLVRAMLHV